MSTEGLAVIASFLLAGSLLLFLTGSRGSTSIVFLLLGLGTAAWVGARSALGRPARPAAASRTDTASPGLAPSQEGEPAKIWEFKLAESGRATGQTVRLETLTAQAPEHRAAHLVVTGDGPPREVWYGRDANEPWPPEVVIGRSPAPGQASLPISSKAVSAVQARLVHQDNTFLIENLSKTNATRVDGRPLLAGERRPLADGDLIEMGPVTISYRLD